MRLKLETQEHLPLGAEQVRFICNVCGIRAPQAVLCTKDDCLTDVLVNTAASMRRH